jgi:hypothetical protein
VLIVGLSLKQIPHLRHKVFFTVTLSPDELPPHLSVNSALKLIDKCFSSVKQRLAHREPSGTPRSPLTTALFPLPSILAAISP